MGPKYQTSKPGRRFKTIDKHDDGESQEEEKTGRGELKQKGQRIENPSTREIKGRK